MLSPISTILSLCFLRTKTQTSTPQTQHSVTRHLLHHLLLFRLRFSGSNGMAMYISLMVHARSLAAKSESHNTQEVLQSGLRNSLRRASLKILSYLLDNAADASIVNPKLFYLFYFSSSYAENNII
ncbi:uncharacterized protein TrAFT101_004026 [Trichoderma asperellum]|uniref:uncharacterized protein n=1 Tax=Trichoderma asperellum TaxID=101201 RepID=UPI00332A80BA|nr:hypothetical protein TrAFT101_004026 [Trichoderma asperellum]